MGPRPRVLVFVCLVLSISISISLAASEGEGENDECGPIFCQSDLLSAVQRAGVFEDNKEFVDMPLRVSPEEVLDRFHAMPNQSDPDALRALVAECFDPPGSDLSPWIPEDWNPLPPSAFLASVRDSRLKALAVHVHEVWINLGKKISPSVYSRPERHTLLPLHHPHSIVAGGRFRETYYWDSFWILKGLLISGMFNSAQDLVENLLHLVKDHGFVPNGSRRYYLRRSQPPMLPQMVNELFASMKERDPEHAMGFLREALPLLDQEYQFWMQLGERAVAIQCEPGKFCRSVPQQQPGSGTVVLNRFYTDQSYPRPESYMPDVQTASEIAEDGRPRLYRHLAAAAESGWDFSSRWMSDHQHLHSLITSEIIPTDLNAIMYRNELVLAHFHSLLHDSASAQQYHAAATRRHAAIKDLLWDSDHHRWGDYVLDDPDVRAVSGSPGRTTGVGVANFVPLWAKCHLPVPPLEDLLNSAHHFATSASTSRPDHAQSQSPHSPTPIQFPPAEADAILAALNAAGLVMPGGAVTMAELPLPTYQQWDFPNAWPPLQYFLVEGLEYLGTPTASAMALHIAQSFVSSVSIGYLQTQHFLEKYDGRALGAPGHGGEYDLQVGFGWTNGVLLDLLASYGSRLSAPHQVGV